MARFSTWTLILSCIFGFNFIISAAFAQTSTISGKSPKSASVSPEVHYQVHSLPLEGSQLIGPALSFKAWKYQRIGARYLLSPDGNEDRRLNVFWRFSFGKRSVSWIVEPQYSYLWRDKSRGANFGATGLALGPEFELSDQWILGTTAGLESTGNPWPMGTFWNRPFLLLFTQFGF